MLSREEPIIILDDICRVYRRRSAGKTYVINGLAHVSLTIHKGEFVAVTGPSGAGKTTLLNIIGGIDVPNAGSLRVSDARLQDLTSTQLSLFRNKTIGYMLQFYCLPPHLTAVEQVMLPLLITGKRPREARHRALRQLENLGLQFLAISYPGQLSGGQAQRVALARALVNEAPIVMADEPTGNLDAETATQLIEVLAEANAEKHKTLLIVTHDPALIQRAGRIITMRDGKVISDEINHSIPTA